MSKELTEQWENGELPLGSYYVKDASGRVFIDEYIKILCCDEVEPTVFRLEEVIVEVVARVPSHYHFVELTEKVEKLEKQLDIATKVLEEYANKENWRTATTIINTDYFEYECSMYGLKNSGFEEARKALKEMEEV